MKYRVIISDFGDTLGADPTSGEDEIREYRRVSLAKAWRLCHRAARKGVRLYGGTIEHPSLGMRGGAFPGAYRAAVIRMEGRRRLTAPATASAVAGKPTNLERSNYVETRNHKY